MIDFCGLFAAGFVLKFHHLASLVMIIIIVTIIMTTLMIIPISKPANRVIASTKTQTYIHTTLTNIQTHRDYLVSSKVSKFDDEKERYYHRRAIYCVPSSRLKEEKKPLVFWSKSP